MAKEEQVIQFCIEAVVTGEHCGNSRRGSRRHAALSRYGIGLLGPGEGNDRPNLWPEAMRRLLDVTAHPRAQERFLDAWIRVPMTDLRRWTGNDDLFFAGLRVLLPNYDARHAKPLTLYRGQLRGEPIGVSWTHSVNTALRYALYGSANVKGRPKALARRRGPRAGAVMMCAEVEPQDIICAPCLLGYDDAGYIIDPRNLTPTTWPASDMRPSDPQHMAV
jgi:hypothetical protein